MTHKNFVVGLTLSYIILALLGARFSEKGEFFPFFHWGLFSKVPQNSEAFFLEITSINNHKIESPLYFVDFIKAKMSKVEAHHLVEGFGKKLKKQKDECYSDNLMKYIPQNITCTLYVSKQRGDKEILGYIKNRTFYNNNN